MKYLHLVLLCLALVCNSCAMGSEPEECLNTADKTDIACYKSTLITVYADKEFTPEQQIDLSSALDQWSIRTEERVRFDVWFMPTSTLKENPNIPNTFFIFSEAPSDPRYIGWATWQSGAFIQIRPELSTDSFMKVALHEIGHGLGLKHYEGPNTSIMTPSSDGSEEIQCQDLQDFCKKWLCTIPCQTKLHE